MKSTVLYSELPRRRLVGVGLVFVLLGIGGWAWLIRGGSDLSDTAALTLLFVGMFAPIVGFTVIGVGVYNSISITAQQLRIGRDKVDLGELRLPVHSKNELPPEIVAAAHNPFAKRAKLGAHLLGSSRRPFASVAGQSIVGFRNRDGLLFLVATYRPEKLTAVLTEVIGKATAHK
jgi:hypothetical protein